MTHWRYNTRGMGYITDKTREGWDTRRNENARYDTWEQLNTWGKREGWEAEVM